MEPRNDLNLTSRAIRPILFSLFLCALAGPAMGQEICVDIDIPVGDDQFVIKITGSSDNFFNMNLMRVDVGSQNYAASGTLLVLPSTAMPNRYELAWTMAHPNGAISYRCGIVVVPFPNAVASKTTTFGGFSTITEDGTCALSVCNP